MPQPIKNGTLKKKVITKRKKENSVKTNNSSTVKTNDASNDVQKTIRKRKRNVPQQRKPRKHPEYGTSKLEVRFASDFLDKLGIKYHYQYKMGTTKRFLDFYCYEQNIAIEVDGDYYHSYGLVYEQMSPMQKRNKRVDEYKTHWCMINGIPLIRIWEHDINDHPEKVMKMLKERFYLDGELNRKKQEMRQRH